MPLPTRTWNQILTDIVTALTNPSSGTTKVSNLRTGSIALAVSQALTSVCVGVYQAIVHLYNVTRLATSTGPDVVSFINDFGLSQLPAVAGSTGETLTRNVAGPQILIPPGGILQTLIGGIQFAIIADAGQPAWNASLGAYVMGASVGSITVTVQAILPPGSPLGAFTNVAANTITQIVSGIVGIDSVTNPAAVTNGQDAESDNAMRTRFVNFISSLSKATSAAIAAAIAGVQAGLTWQLGDALLFGGGTWPGGFTVVVDDGSGAIPSPTLAAVTAAVALVKALGIGFAVFAPTNVVCGVTVTVVAAGGYTHSQAVTAATTAITNFINGRGVGVPVSYTGLAGVISALPQVASQTLLLVNGGTIDIPIAWNQLARAGTITVS
jgi:hypothetical protein